MLNIGAVLEWVVSIYVLSVFVCINAVFFGKAQDRKRKATEANQMEERLKLGSADPR